MGAGNERSRTVTSVAAEPPASKEETGDHG